MVFGCGAHLQTKIKAAVMTFLLTFSRWVFFSPNTVATTAPRSSSHHQTQDLIQNANEIHFKIQIVAAGCAKLRLTWLRLIFAVHGISTLDLPD